MHCTVVVTGSLSAYRNFLLYSQLLTGDGLGQATWIIFGSSL